MGNSALPMEDVAVELFSLLQPSEQDLIISVLKSLVFEQSRDSAVQE